MSLVDRFLNSWAAARQLGLKSVTLFGLYQLGLRTGYFRLRTPQNPPLVNPPLPSFPLPLPSQEGLCTVLGGSFDSVIELANQVVAGQYPFFGGLAGPISLAPPDSTVHWTVSARRRSSEDIKFVWEPARFDWAYLLGRAYYLTGRDIYAQSFWNYFEQFSLANPPNCGHNWESGQEVALRLLAMLFASRVLNSAPSSTPARMQQLANAAVQHARRIGPTLLYARAQRNNHLISEALGLYAAGISFPSYPESASWKKAGWTWLNRAFQDQIDLDGTYSQHSANYHRLMLTLALWAHVLGTAAGDSFPPETKIRLAAATLWLANLTDLNTGRVSNLGSNDGAWVSPLTVGSYDDFRPVLQAAVRAFTDQPLFSPGVWDEMSAWVGLSLEPKPVNAQRPSSILRLESSDSWATLRAARFHNRPAHADQLHVDLWWQGTNILRDPGTFQYNAPAPWDNGLAETAVHNTITIDRQDQMRRAGRFLWLDWAQARVIPQPVSQSSLQAEHLGYQKLGAIHRRKLEFQPGGRWIVTDEILPTHTAAEHEITIRWNLPDYNWTFQDGVLTLAAAPGSVLIHIQSTGKGNPQPLRSALFRVGLDLLGGLPETLAGWYSPTYGLKEPALCFSVTYQSILPLQLMTVIELQPHENRP